jgi:hypothetical protein
MLITLVVVVAMKNRNKTTTNSDSSESSLAGSGQEEKTNTTDSPVGQATEDPTMEDTKSPKVTEQATSVPTEEDSTDTPGPTDVPCKDVVELTSTCFGRNDEIVVSFTSCVPEDGDWLAIYESTQDPTTLMVNDSIDWEFTCGDKRCNEAVFTGSLGFSADGMHTPGEETWYQIHLMRDGPGPTYSAFASSVEFQVLRNVRDCIES